MNHCLKGVLLAAWLFAVPAASAAGWISILKNSPAEQFDEDDIHLFFATANKALDADGTPQPVAWSNPATGAGGEFLELGRSTSKSGMPCKRIKVTTFAKKIPKKTANYTLCKNPEGKWKAASAG